MSGEPEVTGPAPIDPDDVDRGGVHNDWYRGQRFILYTRATGEIIGAGREPLYAIRERDADPDVGCIIGGDDYPWGHPNFVGAMYYVEIGDGSPFLRPLNTMSTLQDGAEFTSLPTVCTAEVRDSDIAAPTTFEIADGTFTLAGDPGTYSVTFRAPQFLPDGPYEVELT